ncbi:MAG TPA: beta-galactosidase [Candidatus Methylacidiphilales bacterium]
MKSLRLASLLSLLAFAALPAAEVPSEEPFPLASAEASGVAVTPKDDGIEAVFSPNTGYPGLTWKAPASWDWTNAVQLAVTLANTGTGPCRLYYIVKDTAGKNLYGGFSGPTLQAGETYTILCDLTQRTAHDSKAAYGMNFPPPAVSGKNVWLNDQDGAVDVSKIASFRIFMQKAPEAPTPVLIRSIRLYRPASVKDFYTGIIDAFGQYTRASWPGKIGAAADLAARRAEEDRDLAAHPAAADRDAFGAWTEGGKREATGFFRAENVDGKWWLVAPNGNLFYSTGFNGMWPGSYSDVSTMDTGTVTQGREYMFQTIPADGHAGKSGFQYGPFKGGGGFAIYDFYGANVDRKYGASYGSGDYIAAWNAQAIKRMASWGFNTIGNWSDTNPHGLIAEGKLPYTVRLSSRSPSKVAQVADPFDPGFATATEALIKGIITPKIAADPLCLGYFCDNEIKWSNTYPQWPDYKTNVANRYSLAIAVLASGPGQPAKGAFRAKMEEKYGDVAKLNAAWGTKFESWDAFLQPYVVAAPAKIPPEFVADLGAFTKDYAARYATTIKTLIRKYDPNHLYLGCRFAKASPDVVEGVAVEGGCDVVSFNIYSKELEPAVWGDLPALNKPCLVGEYHFGAQDTGLFGYGNGNGIRALDQTERAALFTAYMKSLLAHPSFVGAHWFQLTDEPVTGRNFDGENYNAGFVDVADTPYPLLVAAARAIHAQEYALHQAAAAPAR